MDMQEKILYKKAGKFNQIIKGIKNPYKFDKISDF